MRIALYQPEIAGNVGAILRTAACFGVPVDIIEPCGFPFAERGLKRSAMDYADQADICRHGDWEAYQGSSVATGRLVLFTTSGAEPLPGFAFRPDDRILFGNESSGAPPHVHAAAGARVVIPLRAGFRSLNVSVAAGIALAEALRQTEGFAT
jgi:tRNA (cytidine/uridine-2'-O-)-methyltransferase